MNSLLFLLILGGLAAAGGSGSSGTATGSVNARGGDNSDEPVPVVPEEETTPIEDAPDPEPVEVVAAPIVNSPRVVESDVPDLPASAYDVGWDGLSAEEQLIVELVNRARLDPLGELGRQDEGFAAGVTTEAKEALAVVETLSDAADAHSQDMDNRDFFAHQNPDGDSPSDRAIDAGHENRFVGENIGWVGSTRTTFDEQARAEGHHDNLWDSDGHQQNFMSDNWSEIGVGYDYGDYLGYSGSTFVTEKFGDTGETYLTGVVIDDTDGDEFYDIGEGQGGVQITAFNDDGAYATATWESGGYTLALPAGTYRVVFEGGDLDSPYETDVTIGSENVKLDVIDEGGNVFASLNASETLSAGLPEIAVEEETLAAVEDLEDELLLF